MAQAGGIPPVEKQKAGEEAIELARKALELHTQLYGTEIARVAHDMNILSEALEHFINVDVDEVLRLREQSMDIFRRVEGSSSVNVAMGEFNLGNMYQNRAERARAANDLDRCMADLALALPYFREAARIYSATNFVGDANDALRKIAHIEEKMRHIRAASAAAAAATRS